MQMLICLSAKAKCVSFEDLSTQWLWSRTVNNYCLLIKEDRIHHNDLKFDNVILEVGADYSQLRVLIADFGLS
jgi:hypothetical protein